MRLPSPPSFFRRLCALCAALLALGLTAAPAQAQVPRYAKVSSTGAALPDSASDWACTYDRVTKLIWEVKTTSGLRSQGHTYSWYDSSSTDGSLGTANGGTCETSGRCDTEKYAVDVNDAGLCGFSGWRMPTIEELKTLVNTAYTPTIDPDYFPNTPSSGNAAYFWSGSPAAAYPVNLAWLVDFNHGYADNNGYRDYALGVRLVRAGQSFVPLPVLFDESVSAMTTTSATLTATSDVDATGYWVVVADGSTEPSAAQVKAGTDSSDSPALASGSGAMNAGAAQNFDITGLNEGTDYDLYVIAESSAGLGEYVVRQDFSTLPVVNGVCGTAASVPTLLFPSASLCSAGTPENPVSTYGYHTWRCAGSNGGATEQCMAPGDDGQGGGATLELTGGTGCTLDSAALIAPPGGGPNGVSMPYGAFEFTASGCTGGSITLQATFADSVDGMGYWKYINGNWKSMPATLAGNTVTFTIEDNGSFDADPANGTIADPGGPGMGSLIGAVAAIPTLSQWSALALAGLLGFISLAAMRRRNPHG